MSFNITNLDSQIEIPRFQPSPQTEVEVFDSNKKLLFSCTSSVFNLNNIYNNINNQKFSYGDILKLPVTTSRDGNFYFEVHNSNDKPPIYLKKNSIYLEITKDGLKVLNSNSSSENKNNKVVTEKGKDQSNNSNTMNKNNNKTQNTKTKTPVSKTSNNLEDNYWTNYGYVINGNINNLTLSNDTPKYLVLKNSNGQSLYKSKATNVNWYSKDKSNYSGYQCIVPSNDLEGINPND